MYHYLFNSALGVYLVFRWNENKVDISIGGTNGKFFLINAHGVLRRMDTATEIPGIGYRFPLSPSIIVFLKKKSKNQNQGIEDYIGYRFPLSLSTIWRNHLLFNNIPSISKIIQHTPMTWCTYLQCFKKIHQCIFKLQCEN